MKHRQGIKSKSSIMEIITTKDTMEVDDAKDVAMGQIHNLEDGQHVIVKGSSIPKEFVRKGNHLEFVGRKESGGKVSSIEYSDILEVLKDKIEGAVEDIPYEGTSDFKGEEVEHVSRSGFIPFTDGGYEVSWYDYINMLSGSGKRLPTKPLQDELQRQVDNSYNEAKEKFAEEYPEIVKELGEDNIDYNTLYEKGYESEAEQLSEWENDMGDDSIQMRVLAYYYNPENSKGENGKHTISLQGDVNLEAPYHRQGNLDDFKEVIFTFNSIDDLSKKMDKGLKEIIDWFKGSDYNTSKRVLKISRMEDGGKTQYSGRRELGGILIAGLVGAAAGAVAGYGYRDSISSVREKAVDRAIKSKQAAKDKYDRQIQKLKETKEGLKSKAISGIQKLEKGGKTEEGVDLFEDYENQPPKVQKILEKYEEGFEDGDYDVLKKAKDELEEIGYTFEYYLDGQAYDLRKIGQMGKVDAVEKARELEKGETMESGGKASEWKYEIFTDDKWKPATKTDFKYWYNNFGSEVMDRFGKDYKKGQIPFEQVENVYNPQGYEIARKTKIEQHGSSTMESGGKISSDKKKLLGEIKTLQQALDNSLLDDETKAKIPAKIEAKKNKIAEIEREEAEKELLEKKKKLKTQSLKNKNIFIDIDKQLKEKMRNAIHAEGIPYGSKTEGDVFRVFLSNQHQLDIVTRIYNEKRAKLNLDPVSKDQVASIIKKRVGKLKFMPVNVKPNLKNKLTVQKKRAIKKVEKKRIGAGSKIDDMAE